MKCKHCGADMYDYQTMCLNCGKKVTEDRIFVEKEIPVPTQTVKVIAEDKRLTAAVLALTFGWLGAHCFYLGEKKKGILRIFLMFLPPIGFILNIYDLFKILKGTYICKI